MMGTRRLFEPKSGKGTAQQRKEKSNSRKKDSALTAVFITGWNLPFLSDENDIVNWMKREKNGDNKIKARPNEERPEENFRHNFLRCEAVENQMEFERESLHERYRKHCQFGPRPSSKRENTKLSQEVPPQESLPPRRLRYPRSCKSAELPSTPKEPPGPQAGLEKPNFANITPIMSRSHSMIDDVQLKRYGLTLPPDEKTARLLELAEKFTTKLEKKPAPTKPDAEEAVDEGYDSKVSSNDAEGLEDDGDESKVGQYDAASIYTNLESLVGIIDVGNINEEIQEQAEDQDNFLLNEMNNEAEDEGDPTSTAIPQQIGANPNTDSSKDAIAKLMYSRRGRNIYERTPSRRAKDNTFKYAGKEQSRLMETSLSNITPGYLNSHHFAHLSILTKNPHFSNINGEEVEVSSHPLLLQAMQQLNNQQQQVTGNTTDASEQRMIQMKTISIQDRNDNLYNGMNGHTFHKEHTSPVDTGQESRMLKRINSAGAINKDRRSNDTRADFSNGASPASSGKVLTNGTAKPESKGKGPHLCIHDLSSNVNLLPNRLTVGHVTPENRSQGLTPQDSVDQRDSKTPGDTQKSASPVSQTERKTLHNISSVLLKYYQKDSDTSSTVSESFRAPLTDTSRTSKSMDRVPSTAFFPVADLLPAVEKNLRRRKKKGSGQSKQQMIYRSQTLIESLPWKRHDSDMLQQNQIPATSSSSTALGLTVEDLIDRKTHLSMRTLKAYGPPGFRPHHALSPLQRAKEIVNRRLHGHVTQLPDGTETVRVTSPQYQTTRLDRINSASRKLGKMVKGTWKECNDLRSKSETAVMREQRRTAMADVHLRGN